MSLPAQFALSTLPPLAAFLVERGVRNEELMEVLEDAEGYTEVAPAVVATLGVLLDEWLGYSRWMLSEQSPFAEPFVFLAMSDHIAVVHAFRELLP